jgi:hypothetical protein
MLKRLLGLHSSIHTNKRLAHSLKVTKTPNTYHGWLNFRNLAKATFIAGLTIPISVYVVGGYAAEKLNASSEKIFNQDVENGRINVPFLMEIASNLLRDSLKSPDHNLIRNILIGDKTEANFTFKSDSTVEISKSKALFTNLCRVHDKMAKTASCKLLAHHFMATINVFIPLECPRGEYLVKCTLVTGDVDNGSYQMGLQQVELCPQSSDTKSKISNMTSNIILYKATEPHCGIVARHVLLLERK